MNNTTIKNYLVLILCSLTITSCDRDFEEINVNPSKPTATFMAALFNGVVESLQLTWNGQFYVDNEILYPATQLGALIGNDWSNTALGIDAIWENYYHSLKNIRELEDRFDNYSGSQEELVNVRAMTKILLAYKTFTITDLFGDIPFFDAGKGNQDLKYLKPKYDDQESIYKFLLQELQWAVENIDLNGVSSEGLPLYSFGSYDALLNSDMSRWIKFANALRLRYAMRMVEVDEFFAAPIISEIIDNNSPVIEEGEDVVLRPVSLGYTKESTHWSFREHKNLRMGSTMWSAMQGDSTDRDPRLPIFFDVNNAGAWAPYPNALPTGTAQPVEGGIPYGGQRDGGYAIRGIENKYSSFQYYLIRDENDIPEILMTAAEVRFHKAEAILRGIGTIQNENLADTEYTLGISQSLKFWNSEVQNCEIWEPKVTISNTEIFSYPVAPAVSLSNNNFDLNLIYTQKWLHYFRQPREAFALARRTGRTPREGDALRYNRLKYPASEANYNTENYQAQVAKMGGDLNEVKMWWQE